MPAFVHPSQHAVKYCVTLRFVINENMPVPIFTECTQNLEWFDNEVSGRTVKTPHESEMTVSLTTDFQSLAPGGVEFSIRESVIITRAKIDEILMQSNPDILNFAIQTFTIQYDNRKLEKRATNTFFVF